MDFVKRNSKLQKVILSQSVGGSLSKNVKDSDEIFCKK